MPELPRLVLADDDRRKVEVVAALVAIGSQNDGSGDGGDGGVTLTNRLHAYADRLQARGKKPPLHVIGPSYAGSTACDTIMAAACAGYTGISGYSSPLTDPAWQLTTPDTWGGHLSRSGDLIYGDIAAQQIAAALA